MLPVEYQIDFRDTFRTLWNLYDVSFLWKKWKPKRSHLYLQKSSIIDVWQGSKYASDLNFIQFNLHQRTLYYHHHHLCTSRTKMLLKKTVEYAWLTKFQNFIGKKKAKLILNTFSFPGGWEFPEYKGNTFFLNHLQVAACFLN